MDIIKRMDFAFVILLILFSAALLVFAVGFLTFLVLYLILPTAKGAFYAPTQDAVLSDMLKLADVKPGESAVDVGSGDGKIVIALAKAGAKAHGCEINPLLVWWSKRKIQQERLGQNATVSLGNLWNQDFRLYDVITVYGIPYIMEDLKKKLRREAKSGTRIVSNGFPFPDWKHEKRIGRAYLYTIKNRLEASNSNSPTRHGSRL